MSRIKNSFEKLIFNIYLILATGFVLLSCSTSTKTTNAVSIASDVVAISGVAASEHKDSSIVLLAPTVKHQIALSGTLKCESQKFMRYDQLSVEVWMNGKLHGSINVDPTGIYTGIVKTDPGLHSAKLFHKQKRKYLDSQDFTSSESTDRFEINLKACQ